MYCGKDIAFARSMLSEIGIEFHWDFMFEIKEHQNNTQNQYGAGFYRNPNLNADGIGADFHISLADMTTRRQ